jgi:uncharacterized protein (DUF58 family)
MYLTRRGYGVLAIVVVAELSALTYGGRTLNAIVAPSVIALVGAAVSLYRADTPSAERESVEPGFPGESSTVSVDMSGGGVASVTQPLLTADGSPLERDDSATDGSAGITASGADQSLSLPGEFQFRLSFERRGIYRLGHLQVTVTDLLGLLAEDYEIGGTTDVIVYPAVYHVAGRQRFMHDILDERDVERDEFDALREYTPGDPLRDVHWKSSAKDPETLFVKEFVDRRVDEDVVVTASATPGYGDEMATAAASVAVMALNADLNVALYAGRAAVPLGRGREHRTAILETLAEVEAAPLPDDLDVDADVRIHADADGVEVRLGARTSSLRELTVSRSNPLTTEGVES